ncbi:hypothetical protein TNCV_1715931 [Trichonephila clavipes]|nr:hypothetical protein TNCV_1715931 [Trichonephila clavipes]
MSLMNFKSEVVGRLEAGRWWHNHYKSSGSRLVVLSRGSDEAHFWLNGYVNKQNFRIWSEANPQVYVEAPLHLEKLTVWCALWAGGILQKQ